MANVVLIATGGIRAHRQVELAELLSARGHRLRCLNTNRSLLFLFAWSLKRPLRMLRHLARMHTPFSEIFCYFAEYTKQVSHVGTARWADVLVVAPATCNSIAKIANGITDNYPLLVIRAFERGRQVLIAPSMNPEMWADPANLDNVTKLKATQKYALVGPVAGTSVSGEAGFGIMASNEAIIDAIEATLRAKTRPSSLAG